MRIVIAGGTGLIGRPLVSTLLGDGHEIVVLSRNPDKYWAILPEKVLLVPWDAQTAGKWSRELDGADAIINLAGENLAGDNFLPGRWTEQKKRRVRESRINAGSAIVEGIKAVENKPHLLIQSSAVGYYGPGTDDIVTEKTPPGEDFLSMLCVEWEASSAEVESLGVRRAVIRTGLVLTPDGGPLARELLLFKLYSGGYFGDGKQWWPWIHMEDVIRSIQFLLEKSQAKGPFNLAAPNPVTNRDFGQIMGKVMGKPALVPVPRFALNIVVGEVATIVADGQRAVPEKLIDQGFTFRFAELEPALRDLLAG
jgi:uncharacterized protein (TIGR01777 family)